MLGLIKEHAPTHSRIFVGVIDPIDPTVETPDEVRDRVLEAAEYIPLDRLGTCDDCGFSPFGDDTSTSRETAFAKIAARAQGTAMAAQQLGVVPADSIELVAGEEVRIPLAGAGSVGYVWDVETDRDGIVDVTVEPAAAVSRPAGGPPPPSGSLQEVAVVRALRPGTVAITLSLRRPWEPERPPREVHRLEVTVGKRSADPGS